MFLKKASTHQEVNIWLLRVSRLLTKWSDVKRSGLPGYLQATSIWSPITEAASYVSRYVKRSTPAPLIPSSLALKNGKVLHASEAHGTHQSDLQLMPQHLVLCDWWLWLVAHLKLLLLHAHHVGHAAWHLDHAGVVGPCGHEFVGCHVSRPVGAVQPRASYGQR